MADNKTAGAMNTLVGKTTVISAATNDKTDLAGQISSRSVILMTQDKLTDADSFAAVGGLAGINYDAQVSAMPIYEMGSNRFVIPDSRPMPFRLGVTKNFLNGRNLLASLYRKNKDDLKANNVKTSNFITDITRNALRKPTDFIVGVQNVDDTGNSSGKKLKNCYLESYALSIDADRVVITEQASFIGEVVQDALTGISASSFKPDKEEMLDTADLDTFGNAGGITSMTIVFAIVTEGATDATDTYSPIGGLRGVNLTCQNIVTPNPEIGSKATVIILGKPQPFMGSLQKLFINRESLLSALTSKHELSSESKELKFNIDMANKEVSMPRDYALLIYSSTKDENPALKYVIRLRQCKITNFSFSSGDTMPLNEQVNIMGERLEEISAS